MICREVEERAESYLAGGLDQAERAGVDAHIESCDECGSLVGENDGIASGLMSGPPPLQAPPRVKRRLLERIEADSPKTRRFPRLLPGAQPFLAMSAVLVVALALAAMWSAGRTGGVESVGAVSNMDTGEGEDQLFLAYSVAAPGLAVEELSATRATDTARGMFLAPRSSNSALLAGIGMPQIPKEMTYCVWFITYGQRYRAGTFQVDSTGYGYVNLRLFVPLSWIEAISVTIEERERPGGDPADLPQGPTVLRGDF